MVWDAHYPPEIPSMKAQNLAEVLLIALGALELSACGGPRVTNTSLEACNQSLAIVSSSVRGPDSVAYANAMLGIAGGLAGVAMRNALAQGFSLDIEDRITVSPPPTDSASFARSICEAANGLTAKQIVARVDSLSRAAAAILERQSAREYIQLLHSEASHYAEVQDSLKEFRVVGAQLRQTEGFIGLETTIVLTVLNGTGHAISRAHFRGKAMSEGRQVPWLDEEFNYSIPGGLEPGEQRTWRLSPNMFQDAWTRVRVPSDARFDVEVTELDGADGEPLWGGKPFTRADQRLLDSLVARFGAD